MALFLRTKAKKWHRNFWCRLLGHRWDSGWYGSVPYLKIMSTAWDNLDEAHFDLGYECSRCGEVHRVGRIHGSTTMGQLMKDQCRGRNLRRFQYGYAEK